MYSEAGVALGGAVRIISHQDVGAGAGKDPPWALRHVQSCTVDICGPVNVLRSQN